MNAFIRIALGVLSFTAPFGLMALALIQPIAGPGRHVEYDALRLFFGGSSLFLCFIFMLNAARSSVIPRPKRRLWLVILVMTNVFALPFYWFWYIRPDSVANE